MSEVEQVEEFGDGYEYGDEGDGVPGSPGGLEFQDFSQMGGMNGNMSHIGGDSMNEKLLPQPSSGGDSGSGRNNNNNPVWKDATCFSLDYYRQFFDVDTEQVVFRIRSSFWPINNKFMEQIQDKGDLYGPIWVTTTLIFVTAMAGNIVDWKNSYGQDSADAWRYDFNKVTLAATVIYSYIGVVPVLLWGVLKYFNSTGNTPPSLLDILTVYGYSLFVYIPVAIVCIFPWIGSSIDWVAIGIAMLMSGTVLVINFWKAAQETKKKWILAAIAICHIGLSVALKLYFFKHVAMAPGPVGNTTVAPDRAIPEALVAPPGVVGDVGGGAVAAAAAAAETVATTVAAAVAAVANAAVASAGTEVAAGGLAATPVAVMPEGGRQQAGGTRHRPDNDDASPMFKAKAKGNPKKKHNRTHAGGMGGARDRD